MIILCIISIYALAHYSHFLLTLGTVKHFPHVRILVGYSTACVTSWYNGISEEMVLTCIPLHFLGFSVFNTCFESLFDIIQIFLYFWGWDFSQYLYFQERCSETKRQRFQNVFHVICRTFKNLVQSSFLRACYEVQVVPWDILL